MRSQLEWTHYDEELTFSELMKSFLLMGASLSPPVNSRMSLTSAPVAMTVTCVVNATCQKLYKRPNGFEWSMRSGQHGIPGSCSR